MEILIAALLIGIGAALILAGKNGSAGSLWDTLTAGGSTGSGTTPPAAGGGGGGGSISRVL